MSAGWFRRFLYKWTWDTRCRNVDVARVLKPFVKTDTTILDAGCGEHGLAAFVASKKITGIDILPDHAAVDAGAFIHGSIFSLPFADRSFNIAASVDVLEHLPDNIRSEAVKQLVNISSAAMLIAFPSGKIAREMDEAFNNKLNKTGQPIPDWLAEHLENPYPNAESVATLIKTEAEKTGRQVSTTIFYSESPVVARTLRWLAIRSTYLYVLGNLFAGLFLPVLPKAGKYNAYRSIILAEFKND